MGVVERLQKEWPVIQQAPFSFTLIAIALLALTWAAASWLYRHQIGNLKERIGLKDDLITDYKRKLDGATPDEARERLDALEMLVGHLRPRELTQRQALIVAQNLDGYAGKTAGVGYAMNDRVCERYAEQLKNILVQSGWAIKTTAILSSWGRGFPGLAVIARPDDNSPALVALLAGLTEAGVAFVRIDDPVSDNLVCRLNVGPMAA